MEKTLTKTVVFIAGTFLGNNCWDEWKMYFESKGYKCIAPSWPYKNVSPEELRNRHPDASIASNRLTDIMNFHAAIINALAEKPIVIGHSLGGLIVQLLLQRDLVYAGVAVHSFPPPNTTIMKPSFLNEWWQAMGFFTDPGKSYLISFRKWKQDFGNEMSCEKQKELYYKYAIPESKLLIRDCLNCNAKINFKNLHPPLLFTSGGYDRIIPAALNYTNYKNYKIGESITDYKNFRFHNHLVFDHLAYKEEAGFILNWLQELKYKSPLFKQYKPEQ